MKTILITGATSGIGRATAIAMANDNNRLIITGRREERLKELAHEIQVKFKSEVLILCFDVRDKEAVKNAINSIPKEWKNIDVLVNNAGLALGFEPIQEGSIEDWDNMIDSNVKGLLYVSHHVIPLMIEQNSGHIINIGSIAGKEVYPGGNVYCATKHAVEAITKAMRMDLVKHNIKVSQVAPAATETEFSIVRYHGDEKRAKDTYKGYKPLVGEDIANVIKFMIEQPPHVCKNDVFVAPTAQASATVWNKKL